MLDIDKNLFWKEYVLASYKSGSIKIKIFLGFLTIFDIFIVVFMINEL